MTKLLSGVRVKIDRAKKHFADLDAAIKAFEARKPFDVITDTKTDPRYEIYRFMKREAIPAEWSAVIGDCIHNLRSALDHLAVELVLDGGGVPTDYTAFPIGRDKIHFDSSAISRIDGASPLAIDKVCKLKPYAGTDSPIYTLHRLDILDKHAAIIPVAVSQNMWGFQWDIREPGTEHYPPARMLRGPPSKPRIALEDGDELGSYLRKTGENVEDKSEFDFGFEISFGKNQVLDGDPLLPTLKQLIEFIDALIGAFASEIFKVTW